MRWPTNNRIKLFVNEFPEINEIDEIVIRCIDLKL